MATRRLNDQETELLIQLWHDEPSLWDVSKGVYSNQDAKKAAMFRIKEKMALEDLDTGTKFHAV